MPKSQPPSSPPEQGKKKSKKQVFLARTFSTLVLWGLVIGALVLGNGILFLVLIAGLGLAALREYLTMLNHEGKAAAALHVWVFVCGGTYLAMFFLAGSSGLRGGSTNYEMQWLLDMFVPFAVIAGAFFFSLFAPVDKRSAFERVVGPAFGFFYVVFLFNFLTRTLQFESGGHHLYIFLGLIVTKFTDMGAYITGSLIGKHKMIPHVSPGKTWEGIAGAFLFAQLGGFAVWLLFRDSGELDWLRATDIAILGLLLPVGAILGDLAESVIKRSLGCKDSGKILPGIGGALDLIDSILFTAPILYLYLLIHG